MVVVFHSVTFEKTYNSRIGVGEIRSVTFEKTYNSRVSVGEMSCMKIENFGLYRVW